MFDVTTSVSMPAIRSCRHWSIAFNGYSSNFRSSPGGNWRSHKVATRLEGPKVEAWNSENGGKIIGSCTRLYSTQVLRFSTCQILLFPMVQPSSGLRFEHVSTANSCWHLYSFSDY